MNNPYSAPSAELSEIADQETYAPKIFSLKGRIGRLRYWSYTSLVGFIAVIVSLIAVAFLIASLGYQRTPPDRAMILFIAALTYGPLFVIHALMSRRRLHDLDTTGWPAVLALIPVVNLLLFLYLVVAPGTEGTNSYGTKPRKNSPFIALFILPPLVVIGGLMASGYSSYRIYQQRAHDLRIQQEKQQRQKLQQPDQ